MRSLVYVSGEPGVGKSTAVAAMLRGFDSVDHSKPIPHITYFREGDLPVEGGEVFAQLGKDRVEFGGTDALAMNIISPALDFMATYEGPRVLAEGARLANARFLSGCLDRGWAVTLVHLFGSPAKVEGRRRERGSAQNPSWVRGRRTAAHNLASSPPAGVAVRPVSTDWLRPSEVAEEIADAFDLLLARH